MNLVVFYGCLRHLGEDLICCGRPWLLAIAQAQRRRDDGSGGRIVEAANPGPATVIRVDEGLGGTKVVRSGWCTRAVDGLATSPVARCSQADLRNTGGAGSRQPMRAAPEMWRRTLPDGRLNPFVPSICIGGRRCSRTPGGPGTHPAGELVVADRPQDTAARAPAAIGGPVAVQLVLEQLLQLESTAAAILRTSVRLLRACTSV